jgi:lipid-A-disaccharide synthase
VIQTLRERFPDREIFAFGGPHMRAAGAVLLRETTSSAAMGLGALGKIKAIKADIAWLRTWLDDHADHADHAVAVHVPVDSPAANFPICKVMKPHGAKIVHLVGPQMWAWGGWRVRKLRRLTNHVLCLLPFEEAWFRERGVPATFIGHPRINRELDLDALDATAATFPAGAPRLALLPGSRQQEVRANVGPMIEIFRALRRDTPGLTAIIFAANEALAELSRSIGDTMTGGWPKDLYIEVGVSDAGIRWADAALAVSGTVTLDLTRQTTPMVGMYRIRPISRMLAPLLLNRGDRLLPNLVAGRRIVPEFVPYTGGVTPIVNALRPLMLDVTRCRAISADLADVCAMYEGKSPDDEAADIINAI